MCYNNLRLFFNSQTRCNDESNGEEPRMSENRSRYSSAPLHDLRRRPPRQAPARQETPQIIRSDSTPGGFIALQVLLIAILPLAFVLSLILKSRQFYWGFVIASVLSVGLMFLLKAFVPNARRVLGVIHAAMVAVALFAIVVSGSPQNDAVTTTAQDHQSIFSDNTSASLTALNESLNTTVQQDNALPDTGTASLAQQKLEQFMAAWGVKDYAAMVSYASPNWVNQYETQREAETGIFHLSAIRTPVSYQIMDVSGNDADQTRTITMQASINKSDGKEPQLYNFQILMIRSNNEWYVDPNSISSSQVVPQTTAQDNTTQQTLGADALAEEAASAAGALPVTTPNITATRSDAILYYNQDGGSYYHLDPNCSSIGARYRPLTATFYFRDVSNDTFKNLMTCPHCNAPKRP